MANSPNIFKIVFSYKTPTSFQVTNIMSKARNYTSIMNTRLEIPVCIVRKKSKVIVTFSYLYI